MKFPGRSLQTQRGMVSSGHLGKYLEEKLGERADLLSLRSSLPHCALGLDVGTWRHAKRLFLYPSHFSFLCPGLMLMT